MLQSTTGKRDGEQILVRNDAGGGEVHQWVFSSRQWEKIGDIVQQGEGDASEKQFYDGQMWDVLLPVETDRGALQLAFNKGENPYEIASRFMMMNKVNLSFREEIVRFIIKHGGAGKADRGGAPPVPPSLCASSAPGRVSSVPSTTPPPPSTGALLVGGTMTSSMSRTGFQKFMNRIRSDNEGRAEKGGAARLTIAEVELVKDLVAAMIFGGLLRGEEVSAGSICFRNTVSVICRVLREVSPADASPLIDIFRFCTIQDTVLTCLLESGPGMELTRCVMGRIQDDAWYAAAGAEEKRAIHVSILLRALANATGSPGRTAAALKSKALREQVWNYVSNITPAAAAADPRIAGSLGSLVCNVARGMYEGQYVDGAKQVVGGVGVILDCFLGAESPAPPALVEAAASAVAAVGTLVLSCMSRRLLVVIREAALPEKIQAVAAVADVETAPSLAVCVGEWQTVYRSVPGE